MAINPETQYAGKIKPSSAEYPFGEARNITLPGDGTGTPWEAALVNDIFGFQQALLNEASIVPSGDPETALVSQYLDAAKKVIGGDKPLFVISIAEAFSGLEVVDGKSYHANGWHPGSNIGGGVFVGRASVPKSQHNGGSIISPTVPPVSEQAGASLSERRDNFLAGAGETDSAGSGCFVREGKPRYSFSDFGAIGDGSQDDTGAFLKANATGHPTEGLPGVSLLVNKLTAPENNLDILFHGDSGLIVSNSDLTGDGITVSGVNAKWHGGSVTVSGAGYFSGYIIAFSGEEADVFNVEAYYGTKPAYVGDGVNIPYNTGVMAIRNTSHNSRVSKCKLYNGEGAGLWNSGRNTVIDNNLMRDSILGLALSDNDNATVTNNNLFRNNAGGSLSGADGILSYGSKGHTIRGNLIHENGEHGTYIQSTGNTIVGNIVFNNDGSGLKASGKDSVITGNVCYNNGDGATQTDNGDIYIQSPLGRLVLSGNNCFNTNGTFGIRTVWLSDKAITGEEKNVTISNNLVTGTYSQEAMRLGGESDFTVSGNVTDGTIRLSVATTGHPQMTGIVCSSNISKRINIDKSIDTLLHGNTMEVLTISSGILAIIKNNKITAQSERVSMNGVKELSGNTIEYTIVSDSQSFLEQSAQVASNSNKVISNNVFNSAGGRLLFFTTEGISGDYIAVLNNELNGAVQSVYMWGQYHQFVGNRSLSGSLGFIRGTECIITNNMGGITIENNATHAIANNITPV